MKTFKDRLHSEGVVVHEWPKAQNQLWRLTLRIKHHAPVVELRAFKRKKIDGTDQWIPVEGKGTSVHAKHLDDLIDALTEARDKAASLGLKLD